MTVRFDLVTLFPEVFTPFLTQGVNRRAFESGQVEVRVWPLRDHADGAYRRVDDRPYGGGPGMVMMAEPLARCVAAIRSSRADGGAPPAPVVLFSPAGERLNHAAVTRWASGDGGILICGRYEGIDQRFIDQCVDHQISLGDFVLSGGEIAALALLDAVARLQPGVLNDQGSHQQDSFNPMLDGLLDCPHYTRPEHWNHNGQSLGVPPVLLSGDHARIARYRRDCSLALTAQTRPDVLAQSRSEGRLTDADERFLRSCAGPTS